MAKNILLEAGSLEVYVFGSASDLSASHEARDLDIAVRGLSPDKFFPVYGLLIGALKHPVDLVPLNRPSAFTRLLLRGGSLRRVA